jgi:hypothetical protein
MKATNQTYIPVAYDSFWDRFDWTLYSRVMKAKKMEFDDEERIKVIFNKLKQIIKK